MRTFAALVTASILLNPIAALAEFACPRTSGNASLGPPFPRSESWFGSEALAVNLHNNGVWKTTAPGAQIAVKLFWWSAGFKPGMEKNLKVSIRELSGAPMTAVVSRPTNAGAESLGGWTMLTGIHFPEPGCWEITGNLSGPGAQVRCRDSSSCRNRSVTVILERVERLALQGSRCQRPAREQLTRSVVMRSSSSAPLAPLSLLFVILSLLSFGHAVAQERSPQASRLLTRRVEGPRPLAKALEALAWQYEYRVSYEDPMYAYEQDIKDVTLQVRNDLDRVPTGPGAQSPGPERRCTGFIKALRQRIARYPRSGADHSGDSARL